MVSSFTFSPLLKSAIEEGILTFAAVVGAAFTVSATGIVNGLPPSAAVAFGALSGLVAAVRDYMTGGNASNPPPVA